MTMFKARAGMQPGVGRGLGGYAFLSHHITTMCKLHCVIRIRSMKMDTGI